MVGRRRYCCFAGSRSKYRLGAEAALEVVPEAVRAEVREVAPVVQVVVLAEAREVVPGAARAVD
jgi:hypothetical protein